MVNKKQSKMKSIKAIFRRGQQTSKVEGQQQQQQQVHEDLSRASSASNLNAAEPKGAKPRKAESRDRIDKIQDAKKKVARNNNVREQQQQQQEADSDVEALQRQLAQMANEKSSLALQLGEQTGQLNSLHGEVAKLKMMQEQSSQQLEQLVEENSVLRNRLKDVSHSPLSDNEKQQLLFESHRHHSSAPASIATNLLDDGSGDVTACTTPEWDKHSSGNVSEVSVACLQDKINQMQETHYSTNEELQATLQELTDLQRQLTELQQENERLVEEKNLMFESLCRQTERLNDSRNEVESLKQLLYKDDIETAAEREQKLVDLLKSAQEEREVLLVKQEQLGNDLEDSRSTNILHGGEIQQLSERVRTLESTLDAKHAEHKQLDQELAQAKDQSSSRQIEINRLKDLLDNARTKIGEMEQDRAMGDKSELDELLDNARKEKDSLESEVAHLKEQLAISRNESEKLKEQVSILQEECKVIRNNAKTIQSDLEYKCEKLAAEKAALGEQLQQFQEAVNELQVQAQCHSDDKRQLSAVLSETQRNLNESERKVMTLENELMETKRLRMEQEEEWEKFQNDLLTSVRVANDFKTEAQQDLQKLIMENKAERERVRQLEAQIDKLKGAAAGVGNVQKPAKRREKKPGSGGRMAPRLSKEEERLLENLDRMYDEIADLPPERLSEEQKVVIRLKGIYDSEPSRDRPKATKPKDKLAISKPLLNSVISNPKLSEIANDPRFQSVERFSVNAEDFVELERKRGTVMIPPPVPPPPVLSKVHSVQAFEQKAGGEDAMIKSKSLNDLTSVTTPLRRFNISEDLSKDIFEPRRNSTVTFETLEQICKGIDPNLPEELLTKEQRLALRLKETIDKGEPKGTLKKNVKIGRRKIVISTPTRESVVQNEKLAYLLTDDDEEEEFKTSRLEIPTPSQRSSTSSGKRYDDITFTFDSKPINMYSDDEAEDQAIPPPGPFRDSPILKTFQPNGMDTFKREHNYLEAENNTFIPPKLEVTTNEDEDESEDTTIIVTNEESPYEDITLTEINEAQTKVENSEEGEATRRESNDYLHHQRLLNEIFESDGEGAEAPVEMYNMAFIDDAETNNRNTWNLAREDFVEDSELDEEERVERRGVKKMYNKVVQEIKDKLNRDSESSDVDSYDEDPDVIGMGMEERLELETRPLSDITQEDLAMVEEMRRKYCEDVDGLEEVVPRRVEMVQWKRADIVELPQKIEVTRIEHDETVDEANKDAGSLFQDVQDQCDLKPFRSSLEVDLNVPETSRVTRPDQVSVDAKTAGNVTEANPAVVKSHHNVQSDSESDQGFAQPIQSDIEPNQGFAQPIQGATEPIQNVTEANDISSELNKGVTGSDKSVGDVTQPGQDVSEAQALPEFDRYVTKPFNNDIEPNQVIKDATEPVQSVQSQDVSESYNILPELDQGVTRSDEFVEHVPQPDQGATDAALDELDQDVSISTSDRDPPRVSELWSKDHRVQDLVLPKPFVRDRSPIYEPVYANLVVDSTKRSRESVTRIASGKKPRALPRLDRPNSPPPLPPATPPPTPVTTSSTPPPLPLTPPPQLFESNEEQISEEFGGSIRKTKFTIRYLQQDKTKQDIKRTNSRGGKRASVNELRKMFEENAPKRKPQELPDYDTIDRMLAFHVLNNVPPSVSNNKSDNN